ncbi:hypothetical protein [Eikenella longinqua]|nr:hypothetical protein [Eikenella longinqua]
MKRKIYFSWWHSLPLLLLGGFAALFCCGLLYMAAAGEAVFGSASGWFLLLRKPVISMDEQGITVHDALNFSDKHRRWSARWDNITEVGWGEEELKKQHPFLGLLFRPRIGVRIKRRHVAYGERHDYVVVSSSLMQGREKGVRQAVLAGWRRYKAGISDKIPYTAETLYRIRQEDFATLIWHLDETPQFMLLDLEQGVPTKHDLVYRYQFKQLFRNEKLKIHYNRPQRQLKITQEDGVSAPKHLPAIEAEMLRIVNLYLYD